MTSIACYARQLQQVLPYAFLTHWWWLAALLMDGVLSEGSRKLLLGSLGFQEVVLYTSSGVQLSRDGSYALCLLHTSFTSTANQGVLNSIRGARGSSWGGPATFYNLYRLKQVPNCYYSTIVTTSSFHLGISYHLLWNEVSHRGTDSQPSLTQLSL